MSANLENQQWPQDWKKSVFIPTPKKGYDKECSNYCTIALISHASKVMLEILKVKLTAVHEPKTYRCTNWVLRGIGTRDQIANIHWIIEKARGFQRNIYFCFIDYVKPLTM